MPHDRKSMPLRTKRLLLIALFLFTATGFGQPQTNDTGKTTVHMAIPDVKGALEVDVGVPWWIEDMSADGREVQLEAMGRPDHLLITAFLQRVKFTASPERCRSEWWSLTKQNTPFIHREGLEESAIKDEIARVEFVIPVFRGEKINQKNIHAYLGAHDLCAEIHLSRVDFKPEDQQFFDTVLATVKLLPDEPAPKGSDSKISIFKAERLYARGNYKGAAALFQKVLEMESQNRTLNRDMFRMLILGLATVSMMRKDLRGATAATERGIAENKEYSMFHYLMAQIDSDLGKMDECLEQLRLAYKYKENIIAGDDPMPDPLEDYAFRKFFRDDKFVRAVREMQGQR